MINTCGISHEYAHCFIDPLKAPLHQRWIVSLQGIDHPVLSTKTIPPSPTRTNNDNVNVLFSIGIQL